MPDWRKSLYYHFYEYPAEHAVRRHYGVCTERNPEQWLNRPDILEKDLDMLEESGCNVVSLGIFSWSTLEPEEGVFHFEWLENIINKLYELKVQQC